MLNHTLRKVIVEADGRYLDTQELQPLDQYVQDYRLRLAAYQHLRDRADALVLAALRRFAPVYPDVIKQHGNRCKYDMGEVLRYMALSALKDDEIFFREQVMDWFNTVLMAHKRTNHCLVAYQYLQEEIIKTLPAPTTRLVAPYFELLTQALKAHV